MEFTNNHLLRHMPSKFRHPLTYDLNDLITAPDNLLNSVECTVTQLVQYSVVTESLRHVMHEHQRLYPSSDLHLPLAFATLDDFLVEDSLTDATALRNCVAGNLNLHRGLFAAQPAIDAVVRARRLYESSAKTTEEEWVDCFHSKYANRDSLKLVNELLLNPCRPEPTSGL
jgi:hypothetical protein